MQVLGVWIAAFFVIASYSFLYGDNPLFTFAEHVFAGLATANAALMGYTSIVSRAWTPLMKGQVLWLGEIGRAHV